MDCLRDANAFMQHEKPWELNRSTESVNREKLSTILHSVMEVLRVCGILLQPIVPTLSSRLLTRLGVPKNERQWNNLQCFPSFFHLPNINEGVSLGSDNKPLYERRRDIK